MRAANLCSACNTARAVLKRPKNNQQLCKECFYAVFEQEVHETITSLHLFRRGERVALAASGTCAASSCMSKKSHQCCPGLIICVPLL